MASPNNDTYNSTSSGTVFAGLSGDIVVDFIGTPITGSAPCTVTFTNQSTGTISSYLWEFGDGNTSTSTHPSHAYLVEGTYNVKLTAIAAIGKVVKTKSSMIVVTVGGGGPTPPTTIALSGATTGVTGGTVTITALLDNPATAPVTVTPTAVSGVTFSTPAVIGIGSLSTTWTASRATDGTAAIAATTSPTLTVTGGFTITFAAAPAPIAFSEPNFRTNQTQLFVDLDPNTATTGGSIGGSIYIPARASVTGPKADFLIGVYGPTATYVDHVESSDTWRWNNLGGDWIDSTGTPQGTSHHISFTANSVTSGSAAYTTSITTGVQQAFHRGKWNAYIVTVTGGSRAIAALHHPTLSAPSVDVTYVDGTTETLACTACVRLAIGTTYSQIGAEEALINASVALEFEMPTKFVSSAILNINITQHSATPATIKGSLAYPPVNVNPPAEGIAADYPGDIGIENHPNVLFSQQFTTTTLSDYVIESPSSIGVFTTSNWNPAVVGVPGGVDDDTKLPTAHMGVPIAGTNKWFHKQNTSATISVVGPNYTGDNFEPYTAGQGALRVVIPGSTDADGAVVGNAGSLGADLWALFDKAICGNVDRFVVRFAVRFHFESRPFSDVKMFRQNSGDTAVYSLPRGKFGPGGHQWVATGGNNNTGGGNLGWSNRMGFTDAPADLNLQRRQLYSHVQDMIHGVNFGTGKDGGLGASVYSDQWYLIEVDTTLNDYDPLTGISSSNGVQTISINGRLDSTYTGWTFRGGTMPTQDQPYLQVFRRIGAIGLCLNDYNGGVMPTDRDTIAFYSNIVVTDGPAIGPVREPAPAWLPAEGDVASIGYDNGAHPTPGLHATRTDINPDLISAINPRAPAVAKWSGWPDVFYGWHSYPGYCGFAWSKQRKRRFFYGAGHVSYTIPAMMEQSVDDLAWKWLETPPPSDSFSPLASIGLTDQRVKDTYPDAQFWFDEACWRGEWSGWDAGFERPGKVFLEPSHTYFGLQYIPGWAHGNRNGIILYCAACSGVLVGATSVIPRVYWDLDDNTQKFTFNRRSNNGANAGGTIFSETIGKVISGTTASGTTGFISNLDVYDPKSRKWSVSHGTNSVIGTIADQGFVEHPPSGLLLKFVLKNASGTEGAWDTATANNVYATTLSSVAAGSHTWTQLNVSATSWSISFFGNRDGNHGLTYFNRTKKIYGINGSDGSTSLWVFSPPAGAVTLSDYLNGTWTMTTETLAHGIVSKGISGTGSWPQGYNSLVDAGDCLLYVDGNMSGKTQAIRPQGT